MDDYTTYVSGDNHCACV